MDIMLVPTLLALFAAMYARSLVCAGGAAFVSLLAYLTPNRALGQPSQVFHLIRFSHTNETEDAGYSAGLGALGLMASTLDPGGAPHAALSRFHFPVGVEAKGGALWMAMGLLLVCLCHLNQRVHMWTSATAPLDQGEGEGQTVHIVFWTISLRDVAWVLTLFVGAVMLYLPMSLLDG